MKQFVLKDGTTIECNGDIFPINTFTTLAKEISNRCVETITIRDFFTIQYLLSDGWSIKPNFYGVRTSDRGTVLEANFTWFVFNGIHKDNVDKHEIEHPEIPHFHKKDEVVSYVMNINHNTNELWLYDASAGEEEPHLMAKFDCYSDFKKCIKAFDDYIPAVPRYDLLLIPTWLMEYEKPFVYEDKVVDLIPKKENNMEIEVPWVVDLNRIRLVG